MLRGERGWRLFFRVCHERQHSAAKLHVEAELKAWRENHYALCENRFTLWRATPIGAESGARVKPMNTAFLSELMNTIADRGRSLLGQPAFLRPVAPPLRLDPRPLNLGVTCVDDGADEPTERSPLPSAVFPFATGNVTWLPPTEWQQIPGRRGRAGEVTPEA